MDNKRQEEIFEFLQDIKVDLAKDNDMVDAVYVTRVLGNCDDYIQTIEGFLKETYFDIVRLEKSLDQKKDYYDAKLQELLNTDMGVKAHGTGSERKEAAKFKLKDLNDEIKAVKYELDESIAIEKILTRRSKSISSSISSAKKQYEAMIDSAKYLNLNPRTEIDVFDPTESDLVEDESLSGFHTKNDNGDDLSLLDEIDNI